MAELERTGVLTVAETISSAKARRQYWRFGVSLILCLFAGLSIYRSGPPTPVSSAAPPHEFSNERAMKHVRSISQDPHPLGSPQNERVRHYIVDELNANGLSAQLQSKTIPAAEIALPMAAPTQEGESAVPISSQAPAMGDITLQNVIARLPGRQNTRAVMLCAHYDSFPNSPGASDDGIGVATLLETLRALKSSAPLKNDVIFLFTDGEEA